MAQNGKCSRIKETYVIHICTTCIKCEQGFFVTKLGKGRILKQGRTLNKLWYTVKDFF